jgi:TRAP-type C4-dicarboxylate transport system substrate-binding protein
LVRPENLKKESNNSLKDDMAIELNLAIHSPTQSEAWLGYERYAVRLNEISGGRVHINVVNSGAVGIEEYNMVLTRQNDMGRIFTMNMSPFPMHIIPALPYILPLSGDNINVLNSLFENFFSKEWNEVKVLWLGLMSPWHLHTTKRPVRNLADFQDLRIHASGLVAELVKVWGGIPIERVDFINNSREKAVQALYDILEAGEVDGVISTWEVVEVFKLYKVTIHHTCLNVIRDVNATVMNMEVWNNLHQDIKKIFDNTNEWAQKEIAKAQEAESYAARMICQDRGHDIIELTPKGMSQWITPTKSVSEKILAKLDSQGLPATHIANEIHKMTTRN